MVGDSFEYAKEAVVGKWNKWVMLIIATILLGLPLMGYVMKVLRGEKPLRKLKTGGLSSLTVSSTCIVVIIWHDPDYHCLRHSYGSRIMRCNERG